MAGGPNSVRRKVYAWEAHQYQICLVETPQAKKPRINLAPLTFSGEDALVVSLQIFNFTMHWILIDNGSLVDIFYFSTYEKLVVEETQLVSASS